MSKITARTLAGFMELEPKKQIVFDNFKRKIERVFLLNGLNPMDTPVLEYSDVLLAKAGGETEKQIYRFNKGDTDLCMRFDLTVPFAKYSAIHQNELIFPFRRYQIGKVFRGERAQKGRLREFYQCDVDIITDSELNLYSEADCIKIVSEVYSALDVDVVIKISNRKILTGIIQYFNLENKINEILNLLDKKDKLEEDKFASLLSELADNNEAERVIRQVMQIKSVEDFDNIIIDNELFSCGARELKTLFEILNSLNLSCALTVDVSVIRGLDYYTGTIFEVNFANVAESSSIGGGGRYDSLAANFTDKKLSGVGFSIGLSRLFDLLDKNNLLQFNSSATSQIAVIPLGNTLAHCFELQKLLQRNNIPSEVLYYEKPFKNKMQYANKKGIAYVMVIGEDEINSSEYGIKNMATGSVFEGKIEQILAKLRGGFFEN